ncbi:FecR family protein [Aestuariivivens sediminis]|uniref:FecR family protein n=1 Tax=Aestuariivivens sediminis TaxID=2913557 RepID=UPI001F5AFFD7|nr:FecR family protein [Aestuariivivens sediminis]
MSKKIEKLIVKFLQKEASFDELHQLELWISNPENETVFLEYIKTNALINNVVTHYDKHKAKQKILTRIRAEKKSAFFYHKSWVKYAAILVLALGLTYFLKTTMSESHRDPNPPAIVQDKIVPGTDKATLTLESGEIIALEKGKAFQSQNSKSDGKRIIYQNDSSNSTVLAYNFLTIPRGGQFHIILSDGTQVWLNSESQLKYPVTFMEGQTREVELVYGEAYFDVTPSSENEGARFKVFNKSQEVEVLGTEFNIKAYDDETHVYTTLVEGKVAIAVNGEKQDLLPHEQCNFDLVNEKVSIEKVDVNTVVSWKDGIFSFKSKPLRDIMKVISRWYDVDVVFENKDLEVLKFKGALDKSQSIEEILAIMKSTTINNYEIKNKTITLK